VLHRNYRAKNKEIRGRELTVFDATKLALQVIELSDFASTSSDCGASGDRRG
jgi:hypothetical protein